MPASFSACERVMVLSGDSFFSLVPDLLVVARLRRERSGRMIPLSTNFHSRRVVSITRRSAQELFQITAHRFRLGGIGRAEVDEKDADAGDGGHRLVAGRVSVCSSRGRDGTPWRCRVDRTSRRLADRRSMIRSVRRGCGCQQCG